jgi:DNA-binding PadR family transcriptional regulator
MLDRPAAGYDLGREFGASARLFWAAELSQIYPTLRRLEARGLLTSDEVPSERGPNRKVYHRTTAGAETLEQWLREPPELGSARLPHVAQFYFLSQLGDAHASIEFVEALRDTLKTRLGVYAEIERVMRTECGDPELGSDELFHRRATLRAGILVARARLAWCEETLAGLEKRTREPSEALETGAV